MYRCFILLACFQAFPLQPAWALKVAPKAQLDAQDQTRNPPTQAFSAKNEWMVLSEAFATDVTLQTFPCAPSPQYDAYYNSLPELTLSRLEIPPNTRLLFYGHSYLHQVLQNILIGNEKTLIKDGPLGGFEGKLLDDGGDDGWLVRWDFLMNSTIIEVQNVRHLQQLDHVADLKKFMRENHFDVAFFMNPHKWNNCPSCSNLSSNDEEDCVCKCRSEVNGRRITGRWDESRNAYCRSTFPGDYLGERSDVKPLWDVINDAMEGKLYEVEAWASEQRDWFHADDKHAIRTFPILKGHACNVGDNCASQSEDLVDHQCQPGRLELVSELILAKVLEEMQ